ncbi:MAG: restriction endonuclease subunit S [Bacteroidales bacterium]
MGGLLIEEKKSTIQVQGASNFGDYPFFTSGDNILLHDTYIVDGERLFLATGGKANVKFYAGKAAYSTDTYVLRSEKASTKYLYYYLLNQIEFINSILFTGSGLKHLQKHEFKKLKFQLPESNPNKPG